MADKSSQVYCSSLALCLHYLAFFAVGVLVGWWSKSSEEVTHASREPIVGAPQGFSDKTWTFNEGESLEVSVRALDFSKTQVVYNSLRAFDELTRLHRNAEKLREHEKRGEANRARLANVHRKAAAATSAESAFRKCVSSLMPELISLWDEKFELGQIDFRARNDSKEKKVDGITLQTLEETAKSIDDF